MTLLPLVLLAALSGDALAQGVTGFVSPGPLAEAHAELDGISKCFSCHTAGQGVTPERCLSCHAEIKGEVEARTGFHGDKGKDCATCHPDHRGRNFEMARLKLDAFDHEATGFPLAGAHKVDCEDCHSEEGEWKGLSSACVSCHADPHGKHPRRAEVRSACETCHTDVDWSALPLAVFLFDHDDPNQCDYALESKHRDVACADCHEDLVFFPVSHGSCQDCHGDPHRTDFAAPCLECHPTPAGWDVASFDHDRTPFRLRGRHRRLSCEQCHTEGLSEALPYGRCTSCHEDFHRGEFKPKDCDACHKVSASFAEIENFDHSDTRFGLTDEHAVTPCASCHHEGRQATYRDLPSEDCDACHTDAHDARFEPVDCAKCHNPVDFRQPIFDHGATNFPHTGKHVGLECEECHTGGAWSGLAHASCLDCHAEGNPHARLEESCDTCHQTEGFDRVAFDHDDGTGFALGLMHSAVPCASCHADISSFTGNDPGCATCHAPRSSTHYEGDCGSCHTGAHWVPAGLGVADHSITGFALLGSHAVLQCGDCHRTNRPRGEARGTCTSCHMGDDAHRHLLGNSCEDCHSARSWFATRFRHYATGWPLRGTHKLAPCSSCHAAGYVGTPTDCFRCHEAEAPRDLVAHQSVFFPLCDSCHRPYGWDLQRFPK